MDAASTARAEGKQGNNMQEAMEFLEGTINGAAIDCNKLYRMGEKRSVSKKMIDRAASKLGVKKKTKNNIEFWSIVHKD